MRIFYIYLDIIIIVSYYHRFNFGDNTSILTWITCCLMARDSLLCWGRQKTSFFAMLHFALYRLIASWIPWRLVLSSRGTGVIGHVLGRDRRGRKVFISACWRYSASSAGWVCSGFWETGVHGSRMPSCAYASSHGHECVHTHVHAYADAHLHVHVHSCTRKRIYTCAHVHAHTRST